MPSTANVCNPEQNYKLHWHTNKLRSEANSNTHVLVPSWLHGIVSLCIPQDSSKRLPSLQLPKSLFLAYFLNKDQTQQTELSKTEKELMQLKVRFKYCLLRIPNPVQDGNTTGSEAWDAHLTSQFSATLFLDYYDQLTCSSNFCYTFSYGTII